LGIGQIRTRHKVNWRLDLEPEQYAVWRAEARRALKYPPVTLNGHQALAVGEGFARLAQKSRLMVWACSILPEHVHLVLGRHRYKIEQAANLLKGEATRRLLEKNLHPMKRYQAPEQCRPPSLWGENQWKVFLDSEEAIENAIRYVYENPIREGKPPQRWSFVTPFAGLTKSGWTTYH
jgi:REP element-mobilizing transposase RayT